MKNRTILFSTLIATTAGLLAIACAPTTEKASSSDQHIEAQGNLVISQVYPGSKAEHAAQGAFIELFNRGIGPVVLSGKTVHVATATGSFTAANAIKLASTVIEPGGYVLVTLDAKPTIIDAGPPDVISPEVDNEADASPREKQGLVIESAGKIALANTPLDGCGGATDTTPCAGLVDLVSFGGASQFEGAGPMPVLTDGMAAYRKRGGCQDTNDNAADFLLEPPLAHDSDSPRAVCGQDGKDGANGANGAQGDKGDKGDKGDTGATGATGAKGDTGAKGAKGDTGAKGAKGDEGDAGATGAKGDKGDTGPAGAKGDPGAVGATGANGKAGENGKEGEDGKDGKPGERGDTGAAGAPGVNGLDGQDGGCSAAPNGTTSSPAGAFVGVALTLAALRRRRKAA